MFNFHFQKTSILTIKYQMLPPKSQPTPLHPQLPPLSDLNNLTLTLRRPLLRGHRNSSSVLKFRPQTIAKVQDRTVGAQEHMTWIVPILAFAVLMGARTDA